MGVFIRPLRVVTLEEHSFIGGLYSMVAQMLCGWDHVRLLPISLPDKFCREYGSREYLQSLAGLDVDSITSRIVEWGYR